LGGDTRIGREPQQPLHAERSRRRTEVGFALLRAADNQHSEALEVLTPAFKAFVAEIALVGPDLVGERGVPAADDLLGAPVDLQKEEGLLPCALQNEHGIGREPDLLAWLVSVRRGVRDQAPHPAVFCPLPVVLGDEPSNRQAGGWAGLLHGGPEVVDG